MHLFFDPSVLPVTTTDNDGEILYIRTNGLHYYGYPDLIINQDFEQGEQMILDILDRIFKMNFNVAATWVYNGRLFKLDVVADGLARINLIDEDEVRIVSVNDPITGFIVKYRTKGLESLYDHPEVEVDSGVEYGREILGYLVDQVENGEIYDHETIITYERKLYNIIVTNDRLGNFVLEIHNELNLDSVLRSTNKHKPEKSSYLKRVK
ncbi:hypothetical protein AB4Z50_14760 [Paenibacillus sp. 2TAB26]|uniref:hypothetical protein n=1 Tax=Paenibacillus sp. 2TAB26 TaxID=3233005 RepID=UPI003F9A4765